MIWWVKINVSGFVIPDVFKIAEDVEIMYEKLCCRFNLFVITKVIITLAF